MNHSLDSAGHGRRRFMRRSTVLSLSALSGAAGLGGRAAATPGGSDYRALVCVNLGGGNDGLNTIVPLDDAGYAAYAAARGPLALPREQLLPLPGTAHGLHPALARLQAGVDAGELTPVFNVGPLLAPSTPAGLLAALEANDTRHWPERLFSHPDQQSLWETVGGPIPQREGWGGRACRLLAGGWPVVQLGGGGNRFGLSDNGPPLVLPGPGAELSAYGLRVQDQADPALALRREALLALYGGVQDSELAEQLARIQRDAFDMSMNLASLVRLQPGESAALSAIDAAFAPLRQPAGWRGTLAPQLYQAAKIVAVSAPQGVRRQLFHTHIEGFDTHRQQIDAAAPALGTHALLLGDVAEGLAAFHQAMQALGLGGAVTSFTHSEFGRTLRPNLTLGTDHAWGNHQFVVGAALRGVASLGQPPRLELAGPDDIDVGSAEPQGRLVPTTSIEQYVATLLRWWGADEAQLGLLLPHIDAFSPRHFL